MGQSTDALLMFGVNLGDGDEIEWPKALAGDEEDDNSPDLEAWVAQRAGLSRPTTGDYKDPEWAAYWAAKSAAFEAFPVDLVSHCSGDYPMWVLAIRRTVQRARRGFPEVPTMVAPTEAEVEALRSACDELGLQWSDPSWLLCSDWC